MVNKFQVLDTVKVHWPARGNFPERTDHQLILIDQGECPMRVMPRYQLDPEVGEVEKYCGGQLNGKSVKIEVREMFGKGGTNPTIRGRVQSVENGK